MKTTKIIAAVMAMTMTMGLCACGDSADSGTTDSKSTKTTVAQDKSQAETTASNDEETSSAVEEVDYQYGVVSIDVHFRFSKHFDYDCKAYSTIDPMISTEDDSCFLTVNKLCDEYNNLTIDADKPEEWLDIVHDQMAKDLSNGYNYVMVNPALDISESEIQEINGRTFVRFVGSFFDDNEDKDVDLVGYLTVVKGDPNLSEYKEDNTAGFIVSQYHDKANIDELDAYAREAAETMAVGKDEWDKME
ncbi:hypothetical protein PNU62_11570 [Ruminococcus bicirculans]|uniref:Secreted protein n=1 Tax=Ruminococcus bicirculans (ex Wegman et al. 2014) TaxID=1160721 RepID=A0AAW6EFF9_9FIRM|nr:hypothetical protein [Ruminococcus bicirculans (ex Wegman et al. 2014)]MDB8745657.1 hypothetical protein [Ruminococcus bicirculans (ex Wegman et al. 2014)]MDB8748358.1 hypothetical protein [Ruminococcus bicirculans (ex Wegman et al. 2014)]MDB8753682.1 hypothetical protein [Ruminococcus bicirculans (ex Wegman et al. 2014)]